MPGPIFPLSSQSCCRCSLKGSWHDGVKRGGGRVQEPQKGPGELGRAKREGVGAGKGFGGV